MAGSVLVIGGPTASGKSALAVDLAGRLDGVVINADSMQVYRELPVLTAQPDAAARARAPHRLYGVLGGEERCSAGRWRAMAMEEIDAALAAGRRPIVVGGTGLYLEALTQGIADIPPVPDAVRAAATALYDRLGGAAFRAALAGRDPAAAARLPPGDRQRLIRAWEVIAATGRSLSAWQDDAAAGPPPGLTFNVLLVLPPRPALYAACDARFAAMLAAGALDEVRALAARGLDPGLPVMKALGVPELLGHLTGTLGRDEAARLARQATRRYAKRQYTWFRHRGAMPRARLLSRTVVEQLSENLAPQIVTKIQKGH